MKKSEAKLDVRGMRVRGMEIIPLTDIPLTFAVSASLRLPVRHSLGDGGCVKSSLQQSVDVRCLGIQNTDGPHFLEHAVQGLLRGAGARVGFGDDLLQFGGDEVLSREHAAFAARGDALDGGGDAFVPSHSKLKQRPFRVSSFLFRVSGHKAPSVQHPSSREDPNTKHQTTAFWVLELEVSLVLGAWDLELRGAAREDSRPTVDPRSSSLVTCHSSLPHV
jgi:hypothetical protein